MTTTHRPEHDNAEPATHLGRPADGPNWLKLRTITEAATDLLGDLSPRVNGVQTTTTLQDSASALGVTAANALFAVRNGAKGDQLFVPQERLASAMADTLMAMAMVAREHGIDLAEATAERFNDVARRGGHRLRLPRVTGPQRQRYDEEKWTSRLADTQE